MEGTIEDSHYEFVLQTLNHLAAHHTIAIESVLYVSTQQAILANPFALQILIRRAIERTRIIHPSVDFVGLSDAMVEAFPQEGKSIPHRIETDFGFENGHVQLIRPKLTVPELVDELKNNHSFPFFTLPQKVLAPISDNQQS